ncbi:MAG: hypothetical protein J6M42_08455 [Clostridia bacterium]|nr:hypothetical protein [Clostridia bacterium]
MDQIPQELLESLEFFLAVYAAVSVLAVAYALFNYVATGVSLFRMMDKAGVPNPWMAWVPFCNSYALGALADNYNLLWEAKPTSYAKKVLAWHIVVTALAQPLILALYAMNPDTAVPTDLWLLLLGYVAAGVVYTVFYSIALYKLYRTFSPESATGLLVLSVLVGISVPLILLVLSRREVRLPFGDREEDGDGEDGSAEGDTVGEYSAF